MWGRLEDGGRRGWGVRACRTMRRGRQSRGCSRWGSQAWAGTFWGWEEDDGVSRRLGSIIEILSFFSFDRENLKQRFSFLSSSLFLLVYCFFFFFRETFARKENEWRKVSKRENPRIFNTSRFSSYLKNCFEFFFLEHALLYEQLSLFYIFFLPSNLINLVEEFSPAV